METLNKPFMEEEQELFLRNLRHTGTRYEVNVPWKLDLHNLPDHKPMCAIRLNTLLEQLYDVRGESTTLIYQWRLRDSTFYPSTVDLSSY